MYEQLLRIEYCKRKFPVRKGKIKAGLGIGIWMTGYD